MHLWSCTVCCFIWPILTINLIIPAGWSPHCPRFFRSNILQDLLFSGVKPHGFRRLLCFSYSDAYCAWEKKNSRSPMLVGETPPKIQPFLLWPGERSCAGPIEQKKMPVPRGISASPRVVHVVTGWWLMQLIKIHWRKLKYVKYTQVTSITSTERWIIIGYLWIG